MNKVELQSNLGQFTGTEQWHQWSRLFPKMLLTDGAKFLADKASAYWLMDNIASHQPKCLTNKSLQEFQLWTLKVHEDKSCTLTCEIDTNNVFLTQEIEFTDFPLDTIKLYVGPMGNGQYIILLTSEY